MDEAGIWVAGQVIWGTFVIIAIALVGQYEIKISYNLRELRIDIEIRPPR
jgi:hypothetical protein